MPDKKLSKVQFIDAIASSVGVEKKTVKTILGAVAELVKAQLKAGGPGEVTVPDLVRLKTKTKPATEDRQGVNPFTKQPTVIKGKPASLKVRATPVKGLKDAVS